MNDVESVEIRVLWSCVVFSEINQLFCSDLKMFSTIGLSPFK